MEPSAHDRTEIERLVDLAQDLVIHGKTISKPIKNAETPYHTDILKLLDEFADVFPDNLPLGLPVPRETDHSIDLVENAKPPAHRVYCLYLKRKLAYLQAGQIEPARSHFGAGVLFARKKDGILRLCIDYPALNNITLKDKYPLPRIDELLDNMAGAEYFTKMDLQQGYHQIRVKPEHVPRTAFQTKFGSFQFRVMPFGLCNAPSTFNTP